jgi:pimeloyl-ACP methyl ester carboxylesterase
LTGTGNTYVLIHSPLVGPLTWSLVAAEMRQRGLDVIVPVLEDSPASTAPYWEQHAESVARTLAAIPEESRLILVAHSGTGPLLPVIRQAIPNPISAYIFVDAGLPQDGATRLELMNSEDSNWAQEFQMFLENGGRFPNWSSEDLAEILPDEHLRNQMVAELHPRGLDFFTEPIPVFPKWPDAPCIYILFSPPYERAEIQARQLGWISDTLGAGHFHMLVDPIAVTDKIIQAVNKVGGS